ncbi:B12-binding domain-containing radical SAM protein [bacterium]|nr:B12-binding domain-containing radical SAM protein [FCB group bacterium]MBL7190056.1 B12-binding domain-containing radical SAM protein [bacterium]
MKILFIRPNSEVPSSAPPMGLLYLGAYLREYGRHEIEIYDARNLGSNLKQIGQAVKKSNPDIIGITAFSMEQKEAHQLAKLSKEIYPDRPVVIGGPYATSQPEDAMRDNNIDYAVIGEGERSGLRLFNMLENGGNPAEVNEIAFRNDDKVVRTNSVDYIIDLDEIPFPAWDLIDFESYFGSEGGKRKTFNQHQMKERVWQLITTRGCPYRCLYCHNLFGKMIRKRSVENVIEELKILKNKYNVEEIEIIDDIFNLDLVRAKEILRSIIAEKLDLKFCFPNGLRSDRFDEELLDLMKEAGAYRLVFAIESGSPRIQKLIRKNVKLDIAQKNIELAARRGFSIGGFFMIGFPTETEEEVMNTIKFALASKMVTATFFMVTPFPGTELHKLALDLGFELPAEYEHYQKVSLNVSKVPTVKLERLRQLALRKFYLDPRRIIQYMKTTPWRHRFFQKLYILIMATLFKYEK